MDNNSFFSIDRLVEFGLGMTMATQMVEMMNKSIKQMYIPGSIDSIQARQFPTIYVDIDGTATGPLSENEFSKLVTKHLHGCPDFQDGNLLKTFLNCLKS